MTQSFNRTILLFSIIRQSSPRLNNMIVIGCMLAYCCVFLFGAETFVESLDTQTVICKVCSWRDISPHPPPSPTHLSIFRSACLAWWKICKERKANTRWIWISFLFQTRWWIFSLTFSLAFGTMFVKTWRVYKIFTNKHLDKEVSRFPSKSLSYQEVDYFS